MWAPNFIQQEYEWNNCFVQFDFKRTNTCDLIEDRKEDSFENKTMATPTKPTRLVLGLKNGAWLIGLLLLAAFVYSFTSEPDRYRRDRTMQYKDMMISNAPNFKSEQRRIERNDTIRIISGACMIGLIAVSVMRVARNWIKSSHLHE
jgi:hypothetical protein